MVSGARQVTRPISIVSTNYAKVSSEMWLVKFPPSLKSIGLSYKPIEWYHGIIQIFS